MKTLIAILSIFLLVSCSESGTEEEQIIVNGKILTRAEGDVYSRTGCVPTNLDSIDKMELYVNEDNGFRYLYGSKKNGKTGLWVSKYSATGEQQWEIIRTGDVPTYAGSLAIIGNGNIVTSEVFMRADATILKEKTIPLIVSQDGAITAAVTVPDNYIFTDVTVYPDFFFCTISQEELQVNPFSKWFETQILNDGTLLKYQGWFNLPYYYSIFKDEVWFISITKDSQITKQNVLSSLLTSWSRHISLPAYSNCDISASFDADTVIVNYDLTLEGGSKQTLTYRLLYDSGDIIQ
jgi:hypothetical protein